MTQAERRLYLIRSLLNEKTEYQSLNVPREVGEQRKLLRSLMNVRMPKVADEAILRVQDEYLQQELADEGVTDKEFFLFTSSSSSLQPTRAPDEMANIPAKSIRNDFLFMFG